jgi:hypothetical protein
MDNLTIRKINALSLLIALSALLFLSNCKDEDNYNFDKIEPRLVNGISGPKDVTANGFTAYDYSVIHRGGSEYEWTSNNENLIVKIEKDSKYPNQASIIYKELHDSSEINITVKETTSGDKTTSVTDTIQLLPFCPYSTMEYKGSWSSSNTQDVAQTVYVDTTDKPNQLELYGLADFVTSRWGESWINGDGSCVIKLSCRENIEIEKQWIGDSNYPDTYEIQGTGTVDTTNMTMSLNYDVFYAGGSGSKHISTTLTLE